MKGLRIGGVKQLKEMRTAIGEMERARTVSIVTHRGPDGDAIGSSLALFLLLRAQGKDVRLYARLADIGAPRILEGLENLSAPESAEADCAASLPDLLVCLDCASPDRISVPFLRDNLAKFRVLNIDHHQSNPRFGAASFVVDGASSTGELVWRIASEAGWSLDRRIAEALWVAIVTDTGRFSYSSTAPSTLECGAALMRCGIRQDRLNDEIFDKAPLNTMRLRARAYASLETWCDGKVAVIRLDAADYEACGCTKADSEDFVNIPRAVRGTVMSVFFYRSRRDENCTHLSIRSKEPLSACAFAAIFGGGGHILAAGATIDCGISEAVARARAALPGFLAGASAGADGKAP